MDLSIVNIIEHDTKDGSLSRICLGGPSVARSGSEPTNLFEQYASRPPHFSCVNHGCFLHVSYLSLYQVHKLEPKLEICLVGQILSLFKGTEYISPRLNHPKSG